MSVIALGNVITGGVVMPNTHRILYTVGAPVAGTSYAGIVAVGDLVQDTVTGHMYEYTEPGAVPTYTRRDTV